MVTLRIWRGDAKGGKFEDYSTPVTRRDGRPRRRPPGAGHAGHRPGRALELQGGQVRFLLGGDQRQAVADVHDADVAYACRSADHDRADADVSADQGSGHRRIVELSGQEEDRAVQAAQARCTRRHLAHGPGGRRSRAGVPQVHRVLPVPGRLPRVCAIITSTRNSSARASSCTSRRWRCILSTPRTGWRS